MSQTLPSNMTEPLAREEIASDGEGSGLEAEVPENNEGNIHPFNPAEIDVITQARTVDLLLTRLKEEELDLSPEFQRRSNIWNQSRKSSLIESMLLRIPIPSLYVSEDKEGNYAVVDGLQRLCAIAHFANVAALNKAVSSKLDPLRLKEMQSLTEYEDKTYLELPRPLQRRISETELTLHIIRASTPAKVKFSIFSRINQGGLPLTAQEIRNAIYPGEWRKRIHKLANEKVFLDATERKIKGERMEDLELVLRFVALYSMLPNEKRPNEQNLDDFLNDAVEKRFISWEEDQWTKVESAFQRALNAAPKIFSHITFRKYSEKGANRLPINRSLFETESVSLARKSDGELAQLMNKSELVIKKFADYFGTDQDFKRSLLYATGKGSASNKRLEVMDKIFCEVLNA